MKKKLIKQSPHKQAIENTTTHKNQSQIAKQNWIEGRQSNFLTHSMFSFPNNPLINDIVLLMRVLIFAKLVYTLKPLIWSLKAKSPYGENSARRKIHTGKKNRRAKNLYCKNS